MLVCTNIKITMVRYSMLFNAMTYNLLKMSGRHKILLVFGYYSDCYHLAVCAQWGHSYVPQMHMAHNGNMTKGPMFPSFI